MQADLHIPKDFLLKKYHVHTVEEVEALFPSSEFKTLIQDYAELFCNDSHEPESFKKNLSSDLDHALMPVVSHQPSPKFKPKFYDEKKTLYSPFEATGLTKNRLDAKVWFYLDEESNIKGPFSTVDMDSWFNHGDLHGSTKVAYDQKEKFCKIYKFVDIFHDFELEGGEKAKGTDKNKGISVETKQKTQEAPTSFKKFGFVNQNKGRSAGNSPLGGKNELAEDPIDENNDDENKKSPKLPNSGKVPRETILIFFFCSQVIRKRKKIRKNTKKTMRVTRIMEARSKVITMNMTNIGMVNMGIITRRNLMGKAKRNMSRNMSPKATIKEF